MLCFAQLSARINTQILSEKGKSSKANLIVENYLKQVKDLFSDVLLLESGTLLLYLVRMNAKGSFSIDFLDRGTIN